MGTKVATRAAFGDALAALGAWPEVVAIDGEVGNSTFTEKFGTRIRTGSSRCTSPSSR